MLSVLSILTFSLELCAIVVSSLGHMFILLVNALDAAKSGRLLLADWLISGISMLNISYPTLKIFENVFFFMRLQKISVGAANKGFLVLYLTLYSSHIWFSTWLCVFFCLTIVKINQPFYIYLQKKFPKVVTWLLVFTVLQSFIVSFFSVRTNPELSSNTSVPYDHKKPLKMYRQYTQRIHVYSATFSVSYMILFASALTIIFFLYQHMEKMKNNTEITGNTANVEVHVRAIRTILSLLAITTLKLLAGLDWFVLSPTNDYHFVSLICSALSNLLLPLVLIKANSKLNKTLQEFLQKCFSSG